MTPFQTSHIDSGSFYGNAAHHEIPQLAPGSIQRRDLVSDVLPEPTPSYEGSPYLDSHYRKEIRAIQEENARLLQSRQVFQSGIKELTEAQSEIKELIEVARSLRADIVHASPASHYSTHRPPKASAVASWSYPVTTEPKEEEDWPDPLPWPEPDEDLHTGMGNLKIEEQELDSSQTYYAPKDAVYPPPLIERHSQLLVSILCKGYPPYHPAQPSQPLARPAPAYAGLMHSVPVQAYQPLAATGVAPGRPTPNHPMQPLVSEQSYRGPKPTIPNFIHPDPGEFARLRMALENLLPANATELFKYQILVDHLKLEETKLIADAYLISPTPYADTMTALHDKFGQPHQLALKKIASVLEAPEVKRGDIAAFQKFSLQI